MFGDCKRNKNYDYFLAKRGRERDTTKMFFRDKDIYVVTVGYKLLFLLLQYQTY